MENHLWCVNAVMKQNRALIRAAKLDADDVYQELALRLIPVSYTHLFRK